MAADAVAAEKRTRPAAGPNRIFVFRKMEGAAFYRPCVEALHDYYASTGRGQQVHVEATEWGIVWSNASNAHACEADLVAAHPDWRKGLTYTATHRLTGLPLVCIRKGSAPIREMPPYWDSIHERRFLRPPPSWADVTLSVVFYIACLALSTIPLVPLFYAMK